MARWWPQLDSPGAGINDQINPACVVTNGVESYAVAFGPALPNPQQDLHGIAAIVNHETSVFSVLAVPFSYSGEKLIVDDAVLKKWNENLPLSMIDDHVEELRQLTAIKLDWGRNDGSRFPVQCMMFSQKLENLGIDHFAEEYIGTHTNKIWSEDGMVLNSLLPFFNVYLQFGTAKN